MADGGRSSLQIERTIPGTAGRPRRASQLAAAASLRIQPLRHPADFQAMDAAGQGRRDPARHVRRQPARLPGVQLQAPKRGTELQHDFLWRTTRDLPERGRIGIFNRSYYEEVLIVRVHPEILLNEGLTDAPHDDKRFGAIATGRSTIWSGISTPTGPASSNSSSTSPRRSSASASSPASTSRRRTGSSARPTSRSANSGRIT
jgi:hypothetical protein